MARPDPTARARVTLALAFALLAGCARSYDADALDARVRGDGGFSREAGHRAREDGGDRLRGDGAADDEDAGFGSPGVDPPCATQIAKALDGLPNDVACIGLYADVFAKVVADGVRQYAPAEPLWADGAGKQRWFYLPPGTRIDASSPSEWVFPVGTKFFKEFRANGRRIETRIYQKTREDHWVRASYEWNRDETEATRSLGGDLDEVEVSGATYHVPTGRECDLCHGGRKDRILGFEAVSLGLPGAEGTRLQDLVDDDLIAPAPLRTEYRIGDDGTDMAAPVLGWIHTNCGVSCHNDNQNSEAYSSGLRLKLYPNELDGRSTAHVDAVRSTVNVAAKTHRWGDKKRIVPGSPEQSLLYQLVSSRAGEKEQMPPIATRVVDREHARAIEAWIRAMGK